MTYVGLACCLALIAYAVGVLSGTPLVLPLLPLALRTQNPDVRARRLFLLRLAPFTFGVFLTLGVVLPAFLWLEPITTGERLSLLLLLLAVASAALIAFGLVRFALDVASTHRLLRRWRGATRPIEVPDISIPSFAVDESFPIVAIVGCARPSLFVSERVLSRCTKEEIAAIVAHESGHLRRGDAWKRPLLRACPDLLALTPLAGHIEQRWAEAAEQAADDHAASAGDSWSLDLASALLKVARLAGSSRPQGLPLNALYRGEGIGGRVARLLSTARRPKAVRRGRYGWLAIAAGAAVMPALAYLGVLRGVHELIERVVGGLG